MMKKISLGVAGLIAMCGVAYAQVAAEVGPGPVPCAYTLCTVTGVNATTLGTVTSVAYGFNSLKTGWYSGTLDTSVGLSVNGAVVFDYGIGSAGAYSLHAITVNSAGTISSNNGSGFRLLLASASATQPTVLPNYASANTGIGAQASGNMSEIVGGVEQARWTANGLVLNPTTTISAPTWTTTGIGLVQNSVTYTDTTAATGTTTNVYLNNFNAATIAATNTGVIYSNAYGNVFNPPTAGTNVTMTARYSALFQGQVSFGNNALTSVGSVFSNSASGFELFSGSASSTVPTIIPNRGSTNTGIGSQSSGNMSEIIAGAEIGRWTGTGPLILVLPTDAATTDNSLCINTTTHIVSSGSGTLGICLGTSSVRYKRSIVNVADGLDAIMGLQPKNFRYLKGYGDDGAREQYGFIAEDVVNILPKLVGLDVQKRPNTVDILGMVPVIVKALQQMQNEINNLGVVALDKLRKEVLALFVWNAFLTIGLGYMLMRKR